MNGENKMEKLNEVQGYTARWYGEDGDLTIGENGGHGYVEHAAIGNAIVHVFYADDYDEREADEK